MTNPREDFKTAIALALVFLSPALAAILLVVFFGETFLPAYAVGLVLVITAGLLGSRASVVIWWSSGHKERGGCEPAPR